MSEEISYFKYDDKDFHNDLVGRLYITSEGCNREDNPFFNKPHIGILEGLAGRPKTITVGRLNEVHDVVDKQEFDIIIWNLKVTNNTLKLPKQQ